METVLSARRRLLLTIAAVVVVVLATLVVVRLVTGPGSPPAGLRQIPVGDGVRLSAQVTTATQTGPSSAATRPPLVVMPAGWGLSVTTYQLLARRVAAAGYTVLAYSQRGQPGSTGTIDMAGRDTQADAERVIDWAVAHLHVDPHRIGMWGTSYGAGVSLLAAARDPRVRAVVATSTWVDTADVLTPGGTVATQALAGLLDGAHVDPPVAGIRSALTSDPQSVVARIARLSPASSPMSVVRRLDANGTAVLLANAFEDHLFGPRQLPAFYQDLTTPKRLELSGGDHGSIGYAGITGHPDPFTDRAIGWLDRYVRGTPSASTPATGVVLTDVVTGAQRSYRSWPTTPAADRVDLAAPGAGSATGPTAWTARLTAGTDTAATSGTGNGYPPVTADLTSLDPAAAARWSGPATASAVTVSGTPTVHLRIGSSGSSATVFVHLYDVGTDGRGTLMSFAPCTVTGLVAGTTRPVTITLQPVAWTLGAGHHLELVVDTVDPRYHADNPAHGTVTLASTTADPAVSAVPVGQ